MREKLIAVMNEPMSEQNMDAMFDDIATYTVDKMLPIIEAEIQKVHEERYIEGRLIQSEAILDKWNDWHYEAVHRFGTFLKAQVEAWQFEAHAHKEPSHD